VAKKEGDPAVAAGDSGTGDELLLRGRIVQATAARRGRIRGNECADPAP